MSKNITISMKEGYVKKLDLIAKNEWSDRSKLIRKWIEENFKEEYKQHKIK